MKLIKGQALKIIKGLELNLKNIPLYKVTNQNENHHGYQYKDWLNSYPDHIICDSKMCGCSVIKKNIIENGDCGFYFVDIYNLCTRLNDIDDPVWIRPVILSMYEDVLDNENGTYRACNINLGRKIKLQDFEIKDREMAKKCVSLNKYAMMFVKDKKIRNFILS